MRKYIKFNSKKSSQSVLYSYDLGGNYLIVEKI